MHIISKFKLLIVAAISIASIAAHTEEAKKYSISRTRILHIPQKGSKIKKCKIEFLDSYFGALEDVDYFEKKLPLTLECLPKEDDIVSLGWTRYDEVRKSWRLRFINEEDRKQRAYATQLFTLRNSKYDGWIVTIKDFTGEQKFREKNLYFCLIYKESALCGHGSMGALRDGGKGDRTPYVMKIIKSIEFSQ